MRREQRVKCEDMVFRDFWFSKGL